MPIETICQTCSNRLRVADEHAGKLARCPKCQSVYTVPNPHGAGSPGAISSGGLSVSSSDQWRLKTADGMIYGPVTRSDMDRWLAEGRVTPDSQLLEEGTDKWLHAGQVYPQLASAGFAAPLSSGGGSNLSTAYAPTSASFGNQYGGSHSSASTGGNPFSNANPFSEANVSQNPFAGPAYGGGMPASFGRYAKPHRGVLILILGILGLTICGFIGMPAAFMGMADLREMSSGRMDPSGKGLTIAGMVMGWVCLGFFALAVLFFVFAALAG